MQIIKTEIPDAMIIEPRVFGYEQCIIWNDAELNIAWPLHNEQVLSEKDKNGLRFADADVFPAGFVLGGVQ